MWDPPSERMAVRAANCRYIDEARADLAKERRKTAADVLRVR